MMQNQRSWKELRGGPLWEVFLPSRQLVFHGRTYLDDNANSFYRFSINLLYREWKRKKCSLTSIFISTIYVNNISRTSRSQRRIGSHLWGRPRMSQKSKHLPYSTVKRDQSNSWKTKSFSFWAISISYHPFPIPSSNSTLCCNVTLLLWLVLHGAGYANYSCAELGKFSSMHNPYAKSVVSSMLDLVKLPKLF